VARARALDSGRLGELRVGIVGTPHHGFDRAIAEFRIAVPDVAVTVFEFTLNDLLPALYDSRIDIGCFRQWMIEAPEGAIEIGATSLSVALPRNHRVLGRGTTVPLRALAPLPFVMLTRAFAPGYHERLTDACAQAGFVPKIAIEVLSLSSMLYHVSVGTGVAILPNTLLEHPDIEYRTVTNPKIRVPIVALRAKRSHSPALDTFAALLARASSRRKG
jgi:DNA-binding transcriptional LysR family regulator